MLKETPYALNQKLKRIQASRDNLKKSNREKMLQNKKLRDRQVEITQSRDMWRSRTQELEKAGNVLKQDYEQQLKIAQQQAENEKLRAEKERARAALLAIQIEDLKKKLRNLKA